MSKIWLPIVGFLLLAPVVIIENLEIHNPDLSPLPRILQWAGAISFISAWVGIGLLGASIGQHTMLALKKLSGNEIFLRLQQPITIVSFWVTLVFVIYLWGSGMH